MASITGAMWDASTSLSVLTKNSLRQAYFVAMKITSILIIGASGHIAQAIYKQLTAQQVDTFFLVSRQFAPETLDSQSNWYQSAYDEQSIAQITAALQDSGKAISHVFICNGVLHQDDLQPEKRLEAFEAGNLLSQIHSNAVVPALWLKHLLPVLKQMPACKVVVFSARVGSINDNRLGGWYSYRASKAALNMLLKSLAVEYARRAPGVKLIAFHPGTTDTPLSRPFNKNVPADKLFSADFVAQQLLTVIDPLETDGTLSFIDWQGKSIAW